MIETTYDATFDLKAAIPRGCRVAILGCANCASVYRTGDTERIEEVATLLADHCTVVLATSVSSPCDQRVLRYLLKTLPRLDEADMFVVLACEAGSRSLGSLVGRPVVSPLRTVGFSVLGTDGTSRRACLFCEECHMARRSHLCPVAACPIGRVDGPCQSRTSDRCVADDSLRCSWLLDAPKEAREDFVLPKSSKSDLPLPAFIVTVPKTLAATETLSRRLDEWKVKTVFLQEGPGSISPLVAATIMAKGAEAPALGLCLHGWGVSESMVRAALDTAAEVGVTHLFIKEPAFQTTPPDMSMSTLTIIELARSVQKLRFTILVENAFLHPSDISLLEAQLDAGANLVVSPVVDGRLEASVQRFQELTLPLVRGAETPEANLSLLAREVVVEIGDRLLD